VAAVVVVAAVAVAEENELDIYRLVIDFIYI
jgi:hypothetical protein